MNLYFPSRLPAFPTLSRTTIRLCWMIALVGLSSCVANRMVPHDAHAYQEGQALKNEALNLMSMANRPYAESDAKINTFHQRVETHIDYEQQRGEKNQTTVDMWKLLMNPSGNLFGGFLNKWKADGQLSDILVDQFKREIGNNFNKIISLENKKKK